MSTLNKPQEIILAPGSIVTLSKTNAAGFHLQMKEMIKDTGYGLLEYVELLKFFEKIKEQISGNSQSNIPEDKEFTSMVRDEVAKHGKAATTPRGVKIELAEVGSSFDFTQCNDPELVTLEAEVLAANEKLKARKDFLKAVPTKGMEIITGEGEVITIYPPSKSSKSSYKVTLPK
jgi:hypothetical protein